MARKEYGMCLTGHLLSKRKMGEKE